MNILKDKTWGWILIGLGIALLVFKPSDKLNSYLNGKPESFITLGLFATMGVYLMIALFGSTTTKAIALAWAITP